MKWIVYSLWIVQFPGNKLFTSLHGITCIIANSINNLICSTQMHSELNQKWRLQKIWLSETCLWFCRQILQELYFGNLILFQWFDEQFVSMVWWAIMTHSTGSSSHYIWSIRIQDVPACIYRFHSEHSVMCRWPLSTLHATYCQISLFYQND